MEFLPQLGKDDEEDDVSPMAAVAVVEDDADEFTSSSKSGGVGHLEKVKNLTSRQAARVAASATVLKWR